MLMKLNYLQKPKLFIIFASVKTLFLCENMKQKDQHLVTEIFKNYTLNDFLKEALKQKKITEEEMAQANEKYKSESESISDVCLRKIETAFQEIKTKTKDQPWWKYKSSLPSISDVMYEIKYHYDDDDILETFDDSCLLEHINDTIELKEHDDEIYAEAKNDFEETQEIERNNLTTELALSHPDILWQFVCDIIGCTYYDYDALEKGLSMLKDKLNNSTYARQRK